MASHQYTIEIKGEGTKEQITHALLAVVRELQFTEDSELNNRGRYELEDPTLMTNITSQD